MKHINTLTKTKPAQAQLDGVIQLVGLLQAIVALASLVGVDLNKQDM